MKKSNDYKAKLELWAADGRVVRMPRAVGFPAFGGQAVRLAGMPLNIPMKTG